MAAAAEELAASVGEISFAVVARPASAARLACCDDCVTAVSISPELPSISCLKPASIRTRSVTSVANFRCWC